MAWHGDCLRRRKKIKKYLDILELIAYLKTMTNELIEQYYTNLQKYASNEWTAIQWADYCTSTLGDLMESARIEKLGRRTAETPNALFARLVSNNLNALFSL
jgi:hypothetical protein